MTTAYYRTQNLYEASYLLSKGHHILNKESSGSKATILFPDTDEVHKDALDYYNGGRIVAKAYSDAYRTLKDFIFAK